MLVALNGCFIHSIEGTSWIKKKKRDDAKSFQRICKLCFSKVHKDHYARSKKRRNKIREYVKASRDRDKQFILEYLETHPCVDCGESNPIVLEFDHIKNKHKNVTDMARDAHSLESIQMEISKCEIRCANCHRIKTASENGCYRAK